MKTQDALIRYFVEQGVLDEKDSAEEWFQDNWIRLKLGERRIPFFPLYGLRRGLILHDLHHMLTGYDTSWRGEAEVAGWELGSGGCAHHLFYWLDRTLFFLGALVLAPLPTLRAFRRGLGSRNLYRLDPDDVLGTDLDEIRHYIS